MKKQVNKRIIHVLTNSTEDNNYTGNKVIAVDTVELLEQYKKQLIDNGYEDIFTIEEREHDGWSSAIRFNGYNLVEHEGLLYPSRNIKLAQEIINKQLSNLNMLFEGLHELKETASHEEKLHYNEVLDSIFKKINEVKNQKLVIKMI